MPMFKECQGTTKILFKY